MCTEPKFKRVVMLPIDNCYDCRHYNHDGEFFMCDKKSGWSEPPQEPTNERLRNIPNWCPLIDP